MKQVSWLFIMILAGFTFIAAPAQERSEGRSSPNLIFPEGIFIDFSQVRAAKPVPLNKIVASKDYHYKDFIKDQLKEDEISFYDDSGEKHKIKTDSLWGYVSDGTIYIRLGKVFNPFRITGMISYFLADITRADTFLYDPVLNPLYFRKNTPHDAFLLYNPLLKNYYPAYSFRNQPLVEPDNKVYLQLMLDFNTGNILECNIVNLRYLLRNDNELYQEYKRLKFKKKRDLIIYYIRKFNERNPLVFH